MGINPGRNLFDDKVLYFSAFIHIYIIYSMGPAHLLHVE